MESQIARFASVRNASTTFARIHVESRRRAKDFDVFSMIVFSSGVRVWSVFIQVPSMLVDDVFVNTLEKLSKYHPEFISAGDGTRERDPYQGDPQRGGSRRSG
jgi:hypothetical protein